MTYRLFVDDMRPIPSGWLGARTVSEAISILANLDVSEISLDHDVVFPLISKSENYMPLTTETFKGVAYYIASTHKKGLKVRIHTSNAGAALTMCEILNLKFDQTYKPYAMGGYDDDGAARHSTTTKVYLAGAMGSRPIKDVLSERAAAKAACIENGLSYYDPADSEGLESENPNTDIPINYDVLTMAHFVSKDESALDTCDVLLHLTGDRFSDGSSWEMARAYYKLKIPIVLVSPERFQKRLMGFTNIKANAIFPTVEEAAQFIHNNYDLKVTR